MGKGSVLTEKQRIVLNEFGREAELASVFYFTGGTALSEYYLQHRLSDDLDFFTEGKFDPEPVFEIINSWSKKHSFIIRSEPHGLVYTYFFTFKDNEVLKVDFAQYPYPQIEEKKVFGSVKVDSLYDIAVNKIITVNQRTNVKDFVDLYFLMKDFNFWQLKDGAIAKFNMELDPYLTAADFLKVEEFQSLPRMLIKLTLEELKIFFEVQAKKLGAEILV